MTELQMTKKSRIWEIDFLRGVSIILMVVDHFFWLVRFVFFAKWSQSPNFESSWISGLYQFSLAYTNAFLRNLVRPYIIKGFIFLAGISSGFTRSNIKRGLKLWVVCIIVTVVFFIAEQIEPGSQVLFGILNMYATSMILFGLVDLGLRKLIVDKDSESTKDIYLYISAMLFVCLGIFMIILGNNFNRTNPISGTGIGALFLWSNDFKKLTADYYPMFPSCGIVFLGAAFGRIVYKDRKSLLGKNLNQKLCKYTKPVNFLGRNTIWVYLAHQIVAFIILLLLGLISGVGGFFK